MAGFVKLHSSMLRSTIWFARPDREIFITALLMAEPREITAALPQLEARNLNETGWVVPPGWYGFCETSGPGLIRTAGIDLEDGMCALERLGSPEPESRSQAFEGRRLVRVDGGWVALNYDRYREKDTTAAERSARYRARKASAASHRDMSSVTRDETCQGRSVTQEEVEEEVEEEAKTIKAKGSRGRRKGTPIQPPDPFVPTEATLRRAKDRGRNVETDWAACVDWHLKHGVPVCDWQAALRTWMDKAQAFEKHNAKHNTHQQGSTIDVSNDPRFA